MSLNELKTATGHHNLTNMATALNQSSWSSRALAKGRHEQSSEAGENEKTAQRMVAMTNQSLRSASVTALTESRECHQAFADNCWKLPPFKACCEQCQEGRAAHTCSWEFSVTHVGGGENAWTIGGHYNDNGITFREWQDCDAACNALQNPADRDDFCDCAQTSPLMTQMGSCRQAIQQFQQTCNGENGQQRPKWCRQIHSGLNAFSTGSIRSVTLVAVTVASVALLAAAATVIKCRSRSISGEEVYEPFMG